MASKALDKYLALVAQRKAKAEAKKKQAKLKAREKKKEETKKRQLKKKRDAYKPIHLKNLRKKQNARAYNKRRRAVLAKHKAKGDVKGYFRIVLMKNYSQTEELSASWWLLTAYSKFNEYVKQNREGVICEKQVVQSNNSEKPVTYEILLLKKINPEEDDGVRELRDKTGKFVENRISNNPRYAVVTKEDWFIPETYNVYGYNPVTDRKTGRWIFDNIVNKNCCKGNFKNIFMCGNKLIIQYNTDFDLVICKNPNECIRLYNGLLSATDPKNKFVMYSNFIAEHRKSWLYDQIEEKTGWRREAIMKNKG